jgi:formylglycine-generating enzyme required for sulfatase activity
MSPFGVFDMGGNADEWTFEGRSDNFQKIAGGRWTTKSSDPYGTLTGGLPRYGGAEWAGFRCADRFEKGSEP